MSHEDENIKLRAQNKALRDKLEKRDQIILLVLITLFTVGLALSCTHDGSGLNDGSSQSIHSQ